jgi:hypothetical protein
MVPAFDDHALIEHHDLIAVADRRQAVSDHQARDAPAANGPIYQRFSGGIKRTGRLVKHKNARVSRQRASNLNALPLSTREVCPALG